VEAVGGAIIKAYSAFLGGTQYTDLSMDQAGTQIVSQIVASDGTDGLMLGQIPQFYGPDGVWEVWLSANNGPRVRAQALDTADLVQGALDSIADVQDTLDQAEADHASIGANNGIAQLDGSGKLKSSQRPTYNLSGLGDATITSPQTGDMLRWNGSKWVNASPTVVTTGFTAASGWSVSFSSAVIQGVFVMLHLEINRTGSAITPSASGNITGEPPILSAVPSSILPARSVGGIFSNGVGQGEITLRGANESDPGEVLLQTWQASNSVDGSFLYFATFAYSLI